MPSHNYSINVIFDAWLNDSSLNDSFVMSQMVGLDYLGFENFRTNTCTSIYKSESNSVKTNPLRYEKYYRMENPQSDLADFLFGMRTWESR